MIAKKKSMSTKKRKARRIHIRKPRRPKRITKANVIDKLVALGKERGHITYEELNNILPDDMFSVEEIDSIMGVLDKEDIALLDRQKEEYVLPHDQRMKKSTMKDDEGSKITQIDDPVKMYLRQMGQISLLTREQEIALAERIKEAEALFRKNVLWTNVAKKIVTDNLKNTLASGTVPLA
ncbi:MAG: hypothetical protein NG740_07480, partial [Omnitrophica bacterium]|nr:hypothetical protein [Candidatus Omnitrophota bacterium]